MRLGSRLLAQVLLDKLGRVWPDRYSPQRLSLSQLSYTHKAPAPEIFGPDHITDIYRVSLDRGALLLESINDVIRSKSIRDGQVIISSGSVQECTYHFVASTALKAQNEYRTVAGPSEILSGGGIIADGDPHTHIALSNPKRTYGGHLEKGCHVRILLNSPSFALVVARR